MAAATMYVTVAGADTKDGTTWAKAMGLAEFITDLEGSSEAGDKYYVAGGTYTITADTLTSRDGTEAAPIHVIGVDSGTTNEPPVFADWATGDNRPLFTDGASAYRTMYVDSYWVIRNIRCVSSDNECIHTNSDSIVENCKVTQDGAATRVGIQARGHVSNCESVATNGDAIRTNSISTRVVGCYVHDSVTGISHTSYQSQISVFNIIDTCSTAGIVIETLMDNQIILNNTIYNCGVGISGGDNSGCTFLNNNISNCTTGASFTVNYPNNLSDYNNFYACTTDRTNLDAGDNDVDINPSFTDAPNGDFSISGSI